MYNLINPCGLLDWQQSGTVLFDSCHGIAVFIVDELQI